MDDIIALFVDPRPKPITRSSRRERAHCQVCLGNTNVWKIKQSMDYVKAVYACSACIAYARSEAARLLKLSKQKKAKRSSRYGRI